MLPDTNEHAIWRVRSRFPLLHHRNTTRHDERARLGAFVVSGGVWSLSTAPHLLRHVKHQKRAQTGRVFGASLHSADKTRRAHPFGCVLRVLSLSTPFVKHERRGQPAMLLVSNFFPMTQRMCRRIFRVLLVFFPLDDHRPLFGCLGLTILVNFLFC